MRVLFLTINLESNSTGRTYALWLLAEAEGWDSKVVAPRGEFVWGPVSSTHFASKCVVLRDEVPEDDMELLRLAREADLMIAVKPLPGAYDRAQRLQRATGTPLLLDIDDPSLEGQIPLRNPAKFAAKAVLRARTFLPLVALYRAARREANVTVSNPVLQSRWGGAIVPHARPDTGAGVAHTRSNPVVVFVGTNLAHKGVPLLRRALEQCQEVGATLVVTDKEPADAKPWESWVGRTTLDEGIELVKESDIVVLPSTPGLVFPEAQLPAKLIDAMIASRAVIVSDLAPLTWALDGSGVVVNDQSAASLARAIRSLSDPRVRQELGDRARARALSRFTIERVRPAFREACVVAAATS